MRKRQKQLHRVDDIHKPKPFQRFRLRVVVAFFIIQDFCRIVKAIPHKDCATDASSNFSSDEAKSGVNTGCIHEHFCEI